MSEIEVQIILPQRADPDDQLDMGLVLLTEGIAKMNPDLVAHGLLGGEFGYGAHYENDTFVMRPYYWGDCTCGSDDRERAWSEVHEHAADCYQSLVRDALIAKGWKLSNWSKTYAERPESLSYEDGDAQEYEVRKALCERFGLSYPSGCAIHCTCDYHPTWLHWIAENDHAEDCLLVMPNFLYKPTGFTVSWYKYIGRGMEPSEKLTSAEYRSIFGECLKSLEATE